MSSPGARGPRQTSLDRERDVSRGQQRVGTTDFVLRGDRAHIVPRDGNREPKTNDESPAKKFFPIDGPATADAATVAGSLIIQAAARCAGLVNSPEKSALDDFTI